jgi:hypothetical protein
MTTGLDLKEFAEIIARHRPRTSCTVAIIEAAKRVNRVPGGGMPARREHDGAARHIDRWSWNCASDGDFLWWRAGSGRRETEAVRGS